MSYQSQRTMNSKKTVQPSHGQMIFLVGFPSVRYQMILVLCWQNLGVSRMNRNIQATLLAALASLLVPAVSSGAAVWFGVVAGQFLFEELRNWAAGNSPHSFAACLGRRPDSIHIMGHWSQIWPPCAPFCAGASAGSCRPRLCPDRNDLYS